MQGSGAVAVGSTAPWQGARRSPWGSSNQKATLVAPPCPGPQARPWGAALGSATPPLCSELALALSLALSLFLSLSLALGAACSLTACLSGTTLPGAQPGFAPVTPGDPPALPPDGSQWPPRGGSLSHDVGLRSALNAALLVLVNKKGRVTSRPASVAQWLSAVPCTRRSRLGSRSGHRPGCGLGPRRGRAGGD